MPGHLIRHAQTDSNPNHLLDTAARGASRNSNGLRQAEALADRLVLRTARLDDIDTLVALRRSMLAAMVEPGDFADGWEPAFVDWLTPRLESSDYQMVVAQLDDRVVAGAQGELIEGQPGPAVRRRRVLITNVSTLPQYRGRGLATKCLEAVLAWARKSGATSAVLNATEMGAEIYQRAGFALSEYPEMRLKL